MSDYLKRWETCHTENTREVFLKAMRSCLYKDLWYANLKSNVGVRKSQDEMQIMMEEYKYITTLWNSLMEMGGIIKLQSESLWKSVSKIPVHKTWTLTDNVVSHGLQIMK
jgi:hypothetical protein